MRCFFRSGVGAPRRPLLPPRRLRVGPPRDMRPPLPLRSAAPPHRPPTGHVMGAKCSPLRAAARAKERKQGKTFPPACCHTTCEQKRPFLLTRWVKWQIGEQNGPFLLTHWVKRPVGKQNWAFLLTHWVKWPVGKQNRAFLLTELHLEPPTCRRSMASPSHCVRNVGPSNGSCSNSALYLNCSG